MAVDLSKVRKGMHAHTSDGTDLGTVVEVWIGTAPAPCGTVGDSGVR
jgi:hypothetical protein